MDAFSILCRCGLPRGEIVEDKNNLATHLDDEVEVLRSGTKRVHGDELGRGLLGHALLLSFYLGAHQRTALVFLA